MFENINLEQVSKNSEEIFKIVVLSSGTCMVATFALLFCYGVCKLIVDDSD